MIAHDVESGQLSEVSISQGRLLRRAVSGQESTVYLSPGWFDVQVNGFAGFDFNSGELTTDGFEEVVRRLQAEGVTRFLPTVVTDSLVHMKKCLRIIVRARQESPVVTRAVPGIHLEGPFISRDRGARGAHPEEHIRDPDRALFDEFQEAANGQVRLLTLAPEMRRAAELIGQLTAHGVVVAIGHSVANGDEIERAVAAGARLSTHLGNGIPAQLPRHPNPIWEQLARDELTASAIFDGHHLPPSVMRVLFRVKGVQKLVLTSDAVSLARCEPGVYEGQVGGKVELGKDGRLRIFGTEYLAGSASSLLDGVDTALNRLGIDAGSALRMVSRTPAELLGLEPREDWTLIDTAGRRVELLAVVADGEVVVDKMAGGS
ncbi:MAG: hypothetical protein WD314_15165 [Trueperaceae bacterium]